MCIRDRLWRGVLERDESDMGVTHSFFELGGNSLKAMVLFNRINKEFSVQLSLRDIFQYQTIRSLSGKIENWKSSETLESMIIPLNNELAKDKVFMIHDGSGEVEGYLELARHMEEYACYGIKYNNQFDTIKEALTISELASAYIKAMKTIQSEGPYRIIGWSLGGIIAKEITQQLEENGEVVENLIIVDSYFNFSKPKEIVPFNIASEVQLMKTRFGISEKQVNDFNSIHDIWNDFMNSDIFKNTSIEEVRNMIPCLLYTSPSPRDATLSRMPSSA